MQRHQILKAANSIATAMIWAVLLAASVSAMIPVVKALPIAELYCDSCNRLSDFFLMVTMKGKPLGIIAGTGAAALFLWHFTRWPYFMLSPILLTAVIASSSPMTLYYWFWWIGM
ncbi:MAG: hypothetical protein ACHQK9_01575 [Reyranellales bacterium]